jgi:hypothetical protein
VVVETDPRADVLWCGTARLRTPAGTGDPLPWACVGAGALDALAGAAGLVRTAVRTGPRSFVELST